MNFLALVRNAAVRGSVPLAVAVWCVCAAASTSRGGAAVKPERLSCFVSILPQAFLAQRVGGAHVDVRVMVGPGQEAHTYEPTARRLSELSKSHVYFTIGIPFEEPLVKRIERNFEGVRIVDSSAGIERRTMEHEHDEAHGMESGGARPPESSHGTFDPHVWLSPRLAATIARNMRDALTELDPERSAVYGENFRALETELEALDREISGMLAPYGGRAVFVFHPAYGYFTDAYGLRQVEIEKDGRAPGPRHLAGVIEQAKAERVKAIFVQPQVSTSHARTVARAVGVELVELDPLARDYIDNLRRLGREIARALEETP